MTYEAKATVWYTRCGRKLLREISVKAPFIQGYSGLSGRLRKARDEAFKDIEGGSVWKAPVVEVLKNGKHHGYYYQVNSSLGRHRWCLQGDGLSARKSRLEAMQGTGFSMLFNVAPDKDDRIKYRERTGECLDALRAELSRRVEVIMQSKAERGV